MDNDLELETDKEILITDLFDKTIGDEFVKVYFTKTEFAAPQIEQDDLHRGFRWNLHLRTHAAFRMPRILNSTRA